MEKAEVVRVPFIFRFLLILTSINGAYWYFAAKRWQHIAEMAVDSVIELSGKRVEGERS